METSRRGSDYGKKAEDCILVWLKKNFDVQILSYILHSQAIAKAPPLQKMGGFMSEKINRSTSSEAELRAEIL